MDDTEAAPGKSWARTDRDVARTLLLSRALELERRLPAEACRSPSWRSRSHRAQILALAVDFPAVWHAWHEPLWSKVATELGIELAAAAAPEPL